jgi:hypothetical protein
MEELPGRGLFAAAAEPATASDFDSVGAVVFIDVAQLAERCRSEPFDVLIGRFFYRSVVFRVRFTHVWRG